MTRDHFVKQIEILSAVFGKKLDDNAVRGYWIGLSDLTDEQLDAAVKSALTASRFMPVPAELRDLAPKAKTGMELAQEEEAASWRGR